MEFKRQRIKEIERELAKELYAYNSELAKVNYSKYVEHVHTYDKKFKIAPWQEYVCNTIDLLLDNKLLNKHGEPYEGICVSVPTQHGKSRCITETLPSYYLGRNPYDHVIEISYGEDFAEKFGRRNLEKIQVFGKELFNIEISKQKSTATEFEVEGTKGGMLSQGLDGRITGNPSDLTIIDDPYKDMADADSANTKAQVMNKWLTAIRLRASAKCKYVIVHTRWNTDDLIGYLLENEPDNFFEITFPIIAERDEPESGRKVGDALLPEAGKNIKWINRLKKSYDTDPKLGGKRAWDAIMRGKPNQQEGNMIKRTYWKRYRLTLKMQRDIGFDEVIQSWDCTFKKTDGSDFVAGHVWGRIGANCFITDRISGRMDIIDTMDGIENMTKRHPRALAKLIEDKANGPAVMQMLRNKIPGLIPIQASTSKAERVNAVLPMWEAGNVYIPDEIEVSPGIWKRCEWAEDVIDQCANFRPERKAQEDDDVDASTMALNRYMYSFVPKNEYRKVVNGYASPEELRDMGIIDLTIRRPGKFNWR